MTVRRCLYGFAAATALATSVLATSVAQAAPSALIPWSDPTPSALVPFAGQTQALANLTGGDLLMYSHAPRSVIVSTKRGPRYYPKVNFNSSALVVSATPAQVEQTLSQYQRYVGLFPTVTSAKVVAQQGQIQQMKYHIHVPIPIPLLSFNEDVVVQHQLNGNSLSSLMIDAPIPYALGKFEWFALPNNKTLVTLTQWGDLDQPKGFLVSTILRAMPELKTGIPQAINAFVLESLRQRFDPDSKNRPVLSRANSMADRQFDQNQLNTIDQLIANSGLPVLFGHRPVLMATEKRPENMHFVTSIQWLKAPLPQAKTALGDPSRYPELLRQVRSVKTQPVPQGNGVDAKIRVGLGLGVLSIPFDLQMRFLYTPDQVLYQANGGDIELMQGRMRFSAQGQNTRVMMTSAGKVGDDAPFLLRIGNALPYADFLPSVGAAPILFDKANRYLSKKP